VSGLCYTFFMEQTIIHWITLHGYGVIFIVLGLGIFGLPVPNELILASLGYLIFKGRLDPLPTVIFAFLGSTCGMMLSYVIGRSFGLYVVYKFGRFVHVTAEHISRMHGWFGRFGKWAVLFGYFFPGIRHLTAIVAGTSKMPFWEFLVYSSAGGFLWLTSFIVAGYVLEERWSRETARIHHILEIGSFIALVVVGIYFLLQRIKKKNVV
jgi:membrane protein DedA with SNARE-associated domain